MQKANVNYFDLIKINSKYLSAAKSIETLFSFATLLLTILLSFFVDLIL